MSLPECLIEGPVDKLLPSKWGSKKPISPAFQRPPDVLLDPRPGSPRSPGGPGGPSGPGGPDAAD